MLQQVQQRQKLFLSILNDAHWFKNDETFNSEQLLV